MYCTYMHLKKILWMDLQKYVYDLQGRSQEKFKGGWNSVDHPMADLFSRNIYDLGYPKGLKNGNFKFFCQISSSSRPFLLIFCQNFFFQKIDLYPFNFELSCSHQFLTENDPPYHFGKGRSILRCQNWNFGSIIILSY